MSSRTVEGLINERGGGSGYRDIMRTTGELQGVFKDQDITSERRAYLNIICHKMARLIHGYGDDDDNLLDIAGYSELERRGVDDRKSKYEEYLNMVMSATPEQIRKIRETAKEAFNE